MKEEGIRGARNLGIRHEVRGLYINVYLYMNEWRSTEKIIRRVNESVNKQEGIPALRVFGGK